MHIKNIFFFLAAFLLSEKALAQVGYSETDSSQPNQISVFHYTKEFYTISSPSVPPSDSFLNVFPSHSWPPVQTILSYSLNIPVQIPLENVSFGLGSKIALSSINNNQNIHGDPVNTFTGKPNFSITDFSYNRAGFPIRFERHYSEDVYAAWSQLGRNWTTNYDLVLMVPASANPLSGNMPVTLIVPGKVYVFSPQADGIHYTPGPGCFYSLTSKS